jgi:Tfp pilus assembly protein PilX
MTALLAGTYLVAMGSISAARTWVCMTQMPACWDNLAVVLHYACKDCPSTPVLCDKAQELFKQKHKTSRTLTAGTALGVTYYEPKLCSASPRPGVCSKAVLTIGSSA